MRNSLWIIALVFAASFAPTVLRADDITYLVDVADGPDTIIGSITTDGTIGAIGAGQIFGGYTLTVTGLNTFTLNGSNSTISQPQTFQATNTGLLQITPNTNGLIINGTGAVTGDLIEFEAFFNSPQPIINVHSPGQSSVSSSVSATFGTVPELNLSSGIAAILLVACSGLIIRGRRTIPPRMRGPGTHDGSDFGGNPVFNNQLTAWRDGRRDLEVPRTYEF